MTEQTADQLPDPSDSEPGRLARWLKDQRFTVDFWFHYTLLPWTRTTARPWTGTRLREVERAVMGGWSATVAWIRILAALLVATVAISLIGEGFDLALSLWRHSRIDAHHAGIVQTITRPVHAYITAHAASLPTDPATVWALWQLAAPALLLAAFTGQIAARLAWCGYGAATAAAVWMATPDPGRPVALALTVALWAAASTVALYGMRLRPLVILSRPQAAGRARPTSGVPATGQARAALPAAAADRDQEPDAW
ncbi:hypothetical protein [Streptacidiphilus carbonis]|uniref:hypothetical protein n=1 Tax=Streptacidiphilus carbonis TaxID=105422 RepID=UPI000693BA95|nr:hypothetical protein [Streptacidiphilus carbonis]